jgi:hypothetical protein
MDTHKPVCKAGIAIMSGKNVLLNKLTAVEITVKH